MVGASPLRRLPALARLALLCTLGLASAAAPAMASSEVPALARSTGTAAPGASAWVVRIELGDTRLVEIGRSAVDVSSGRVAATSLAVNGQGPPSAVADPATPEAKAAAVDWTDDTGSLTVQGGYAEATSSQHRWVAHAGLGRSTGTGIALASQLLTWDQQTELLNAVQSFNDTVTPLVAQTSTALAPLLGVLGIPAPQLSPIAPSGLIDVGGGRVAGSTAEAATAPGFATARADAALGGLKLFGGFVTVEGVSTEATIERGVADQTSARAWLTGVQIAGFPVTLDADGIHLLGGGPAQAVLTPIFSGLLAQLAAAGVTVRTVASSADPDCCSASVVGIEVEVATPGGPLLVSVGGAEATAPEPLPVAAGAATAPRAALPPSSEAPGAAAAVVAAAPRPVAPAPAVPVTPQPASPRAQVGMIADLGADVVSALRVAYLLLLGAATVWAVFFAIAGPSRPARPKRGSS